MMQFGNQPADYAQPGNYTGSYSPPGGGPPPPSGSNPSQSMNYPPPRQFPQGLAQSNIQQKNLVTPPTSAGPAGFVVPGSQGSLLGSGSLSEPSFQETIPPQESVPLNGPPLSMTQASQSSGSLHCPQPSQLQRASQSLGPTNKAASGPSISQGSGNLGRQETLGPPVSQSMLSNGPPGSQHLGNPPNASSGLPSLSSNAAPKVGGLPFESPYGNGSPMIASQNNLLHLPGQMDPSRQVRNNFFNGEKEF